MTRVAISISYSLGTSMNVTMSSVGQENWPYNQIQPWGFSSLRFPVD